MANKKQKHIAIFSALYAPSIGGVETYTEHLAFELQEMGHRVTVVTNNTDDLLSAEHIGSGISIVRLPCRSALGGRYPLPKKTSEYRALIADVLASGIDFVVVNTRFYPHSILGLSIARKLGVKPILIDHGSAHLTMGNAVIDLGIAAVEHAMTVRAKRYPADYYGVSAASATWLKHFGIEAKGVLHNSIDAQAYRSESSKRKWREQLGLSSEDFIVSFVGRFVPEKGVSELAEAARMISSNTAEVHFVLAGDGPLRQTIADMSIPTVHLPGAISRGDVSALLQTSDAFCMPTRSEGFSTSLLEAAACGVAPVLPNVGGVAELMPTEDFGITLPNTTPETVRKAVLTLYGNPKLRRAIAENVQQRVTAEFSWSNTAKKCLEACETANPATPTPKGA